MSENFDALRARMVRDQIEAHGVRDPRVLAAMRDIPRHLFLDPGSRGEAYEDRPIPIACCQTISQPFMVAYMVEHLEAEGRKALEIGTGSGYTTAVLSRVAAEVLTVEVEPDLSRRAQETLESLNVRNVRFRVGNGLEGWPDEAPFGRILLTAGVNDVPRELLEQLEPEGIFLGPVGPRSEQVLVRIVRTNTGFERSELMRVFFVEAHQAPLGSFFSAN